MSLLPENLAEVGSIHISVLLEEDGTSTAFVISDLSNTEAIGHLTVALDRLRKRYRRAKREIGWEAKYKEPEEIIRSAWRWFEKHPKGYGAK